MKSSNIIALGALALASVASSFAADVTLKITGSTAFRKAEFAAITDYLQNVANITGTPGGNTVKGAFLNNNGTTVLNGANQAVFTIGTAGNSVTIYAGQGGSSGGLRFTADPASVGASVKPDGSLTNQVWINKAAAVGVVTLSGGQATGGTSVTTASLTTAGQWDVAAVADVTMADTFQDTTQWNSSDYNALTEASGGAVGIQPYVFAKGKEYANVTAVDAAAYGRFTNVQPAAFQSLAATGYAPLALFTANAADAGIDVVLVGRDYDSGTRAITFLETGYGNDTTTAVQYRAQDSANIDVGDGTGAGNLDHFVLATDPNGNGLAGYNSGGNVKNVLNKSGNAVVVSPRGRPAIVLAYVGTGDVPTVATQILSFDGVAQSANTCIYGQYTMWNAEHLYKNNLSGVKNTLANALATRIRTVDFAASGAIGMTQMKASRAGEGILNVINSTLP